jgi:hypothetical protein
LLPGKLWQPKRAKKSIEDQEICCIHYSWKTTDSARATSTTNMKTHLFKYGLSQDNHTLDQEGLSERIEQQSVVTIFKKKTEVDTIRLLEQNLVRWTVLDDMAFTTIESPTFRQIFEDLPGITLPFRSHTTMSRRINAEFDLFRAQMIQELADTCQTIALSLDI